MRLDKGEETARHVTKKPKTSTENFHKGENIYKASTLEGSLYYEGGKKPTKTFKMITAAVSPQKKHSLKMTRNDLEKSRLYFSADYFANKTSTRNRLNNL